MRIEIFDVEHGQCVLVTADNGQHMLIDCGHNGTTGWRPSRMLAALGISYLDTLTISNCDEDHISDLSGVANVLLTPDRTAVNVRTVCHNFDLTPAVIEAMKAPLGLSQDMQVFCALLQQYNFPIGSGAHAPTFGVNMCWRYHNRYPTDFANTALAGFSNNLSLVTFLHSGNIRIVFPGDLEPDGWRILLRDATWATGPQAVRGP